MSDIRTRLATLLCEATFRDPATYGDAICCRLGGTQGCCCDSFAQEIDLLLAKLTPEDAAAISAEIAQRASARAS